MIHSSYRRNSKPGAPSISTPVKERERGLGLRGKVLGAGFRVSKTKRPEAVVKDETADSSAVAARLVGMTKLVCIDTYELTAPGSKFVPQ